MKSVNYHSMAIVVAAMVTSMLVTMVVMPLVKRLAIRLGAIDMPGIKGTDSERHLHTEPTPRMGGLAIFAGFLAAMFYFVQMNLRLGTMVIGGVILVVLGMVDDAKNLPALFKLLVQLIAATVAALGGNVISYLSAPEWLAPSGHLQLGILSIPVTVFWIVLITNAVNLIDGLDGLAAGVSAISSICLVIVALVYSDITVAVMCGALAGGCVGFLPYNVSPARIFMGDTGATFIGYVLAVASVQGLFKIYALISFAVPFFMLGLPIFDVCFAVVSRISHGENPMKADRKHVHYRLLDMGLSKQQTVAVLYVISGILGLTAVLLSTSDGAKWTAFLVALLIFGFVAYRFYNHRRAVLRGEGHKKRIHIDVLHFGRSDDKKE